MDYGDNGNTILKSLREKAAAFPASPGVYIMLDAGKQIIYIGKAKNLKNRVSSYFSSGNKNIKTEFLIQKIVDMETILTATEYDALLLENNLIKRHNPRYNISLKDGKSYPVVRITAEPFPRVYRTRRITKDGSQYFGPYPNAHIVDISIELIHKLYPVRRCKLLRRRNDPCLYYHIGSCSAPCIGAISKEEYGKYIQKIRALLSGRTVGFRKELEKNMKKAAAELDFERAAELRNALQSLTLLEEEPIVMDFKEKSRDYIEYIASGRHIVFAVMRMRNGKILDKQLYCNEYAGEPEDVLPQFLLQYYSETSRECPELVLLPCAPDPFTERFFSENKNGSTRVIQSKGKKDSAIMAMARQNAEEELNRIVRKEGDIPALEVLKDILDLPTVPRRIEGFDIAQLHGRQATASLVSFLDGRPNKAGYRHYGIKSTGEAVDDFKSIAEAVGRRYQRLLNEDKSLPDLILVDGGKGQVSAALNVLQALELDGRIALAGLAKKEEEIWLPKRAEPVRLPEGNPGLRILQYVRDETHRFATTHSRNLRSKNMVRATLEGVPGIGPAKSAKLLSRYKSLEGIYDSRIEEIAKTAGVGFEVAETIHDFLGRTLESRWNGKEGK